MPKAVPKSKETNKRGKKRTANKRQEEGFGTWSEETDNNISYGKGARRYWEIRGWGRRRPIEIIKMIDSTLFS